MPMEENRTEKISISLTPGMLTRLDAYARAHRWSRSTAASVLIEQGLAGQEGNTQEEGGR
jgi:metal-responsive CopG/Arc/MetJ family transcriptional regulator